MSDLTVYNYNILKPPYSIKYTPLGSLYLVSVLRDNGYNVDFKDFQFLSPPKRENILSFFEKSSDIIAISCMSNLLPQLILSINELKKRYPEKIIILGGPGPTVVAEEILKTSANVDIIVKGEGEKTIVELMDYLERNKDLKDVKGIVYREGNKIRTNPPRPRIENLDDIPFPAYDKIDINEYDIVSIASCRGCVYRCKFCPIPSFWNNRIRCRSLENVIEEIKLICDGYKRNYIKISDNVFHINKKRVFDFCNKLKKEKIDINWGCFGKIDLMNEKIMKKMSESGCNSIYYGIESGSDKVLKMINKGFSVKMAEDVLIKSKKYFSEIIASFIWGFPFETIEDFKKTIRLVEKLIFKSDINLSLSFLIPQIGTPLYDNYKDNLVPYKSKTYFSYMGDTFSERVILLDEDEDIFEIFKNQPNIIVNYYHYKTPNFSQKVDIMEKFKKKYDFCLAMKYNR